MSATTATPPQTRSPAPAVLPPSARRHPRAEQIALGIFIVVPLLALAAAIPLAWDRGLSGVDIVLAVVAYAVTGHGITVGYHRLFTHRAFRAPRWLRIALAIAGSMAIEGPVAHWVADHRRHHAFSDQEGDPHSPWRYGTSTRALLKGMLHAHVGWLFNSELTNPERFAPDLLADADLVRVSRLFPVWVAVSLLLPALIGGLWTMSWVGALVAFFWASLVRVALLHHVTWSINSICHSTGERPFATRDRSTNVWPLAILAMGENWHNYHHADPTSARHGVERGQLDSSAALIALFERLGWAREVRWPSAERIAARRAQPLSAG